jgi:hypothetical protein
MKNIDKLLFVAALATSFGLASRAGAQYRIDTEDGIAASPKLRQMMDDRNSAAIIVVPPATPNVPVTDPNLPEGVAASPKIEQMQSNQLVESPVVADETGPVGYQAAGPDGIAASPKLRQQLEDQNPYSQYSAAQ